MMKKLILRFLFLISTASSLSNAEITNTSIRYGKLIWSDEFEYNGKPDPNLWYFQNNSLNSIIHSYSNSFTDTNAYVENIWSGGYLNIVARKEQSFGMNYSSSGILSMRGFKYGIFEMRAKLGGGRGTWSNFLLSPDQRKTITAKGKETQLLFYQVI